ncbi:hypothetical protein OHB26_27175 [Nocardia sp. NBC_01503]|uniref:hypothetical protein n=1 Tax=Nocardia sp. NBC_01503 TaxID=2975997 RepID=UPI002E7BE1C0|nr:hypothetical protein [Nocardia sp. NBC_01503]WTL30594.1 hypothetical protein OHB26_27175 [Nocardia sp. NBC_01503]
MLIGGVLSVAAVGAARCDIDGGLLDPGSTASRQQDEQVRSVAVAAGDREYLAAHKHDVHADVITFADAVCTATESVRTAVTERSDEPRTVERAVAESKSDLRGLADAAALAADRIDSVALPATDRVLTPGVDGETWRSLRVQAAGAFRDTSGVLRGIGDGLDAHRYADAAAASGALSGANDAAGTRLSALGAAIDDVMSRLPIPNSETDAALRSSGVCAFSKD